MTSYFGYETGHTWIAALAYLGTFIVPVAAALPFLPDPTDLIEKLDGKVTALTGRFRKQNGATS